jgi:hypothetical protein
MSTEELEKRAYKRKPLSEIREGKYTLVEWEFRKDNTGRECLYLTIEDPKDHSVFIQKYTPALMAELADRLKRLKVSNLSELKGKLIEWEIFRAHPLANTRLYPKA